MTLQLLWAEHVAVHEAQAYRYSQYCHRYRQWLKTQRRSMRQIHFFGGVTELQIPDNLLAHPSPD